VAWIKNAVIPEKDPSPANVPDPPGEVDNRLEEVEQEKEKDVPPENKEKSTEKIRGIDSPVGNPKADVSRSTSVQELSRKQRKKSYQKKGQPENLNKVSGDPPAEKEGDVSGKKTIRDASLEKKAETNEGKIKSRPENKKDLLQKKKPGHLKRKKILPIRERRPTMLDPQLISVLTSPFQETISLDCSMINLNLVFSPMNTG
jgi:hypothetical protein